MKTLYDGTEVSARGYYYLLDWNEVDEYKFIVSNFSKSRLKDLNKEEYVILFEAATLSDLNKLKL